MAKDTITIKRQLVVFVILLAVWVTFSGHFDPLHLGLGLVCAGLVTVLSADLLLPEVVRPRITVAWRCLAYLPWLLKQIVLANLHVIRLIFKPAEICSQVVRFKTSLPGDVSKVALGNSITLTPGTVTMDINGNDFVVHALSNKAAETLKSGAMERRLAEVFVVTVAAVDDLGP